MSNVNQFEDKASRSRSTHEGEPSTALCDRLSRTRVFSQRQLPTDQDYAVSTREYQTDQSSLKAAPAAAGPVLDKRQKQQQKQPHQCAEVDRSLHIRAGDRPEMNVNGHRWVARKKVASQWQSRNPICTPRFGPRVMNCAAAWMPANAISSLRQSSRGTFVRTHQHSLRAHNAQVHRANALIRVQRARPGHKTLQIEVVVWLPSSARILPQVLRLIPGPDDGDSFGSERSEWTGIPVISP